MESIEQFYKKLQNFKKPRLSYDYDSQITHCFIVHTIEDVDHYFEVRGWKEPKDGKLHVSVVNWTLCAGTAILTLTEENVKKFKIISTKERYNE